MLYRASREFARSINNHVINEFLDAVPGAPIHLDTGSEYESLDIKVCMLKEGWWPCIPGWHADDFWRGQDGQPALGELREHPSSHYMVLHGDCSLTQFLASSFLPYPPKDLDSPVYGFYNQMVDEIVTACPDRLKTVESGKLYKFTESDFHRGMPATKDGWRAFFRLTHSRHRQPKDEIRQQVQVYVPHKQMFRGW
jgi:hypothetical protein